MTWKTIWETIWRPARHPARYLRVRRVTRRVERGLAAAVAGDQREPRRMMTDLLARGPQTAYLLWLCLAQRVKEMEVAPRGLTPGSYTFEVFNTHGDQVDPDRIPDEEVRAAAWAVRFLIGYLNLDVAACQSIYTGLWDNDDLWTLTTVHLARMAISATRYGAASCPAHGEEGCADGDG